MTNEAVWRSHSRELEVLGYTVVEVPESVWQVARNAVFTSLSTRLKVVSGQEQAIHGGIMQMSSNQFRAAFGDKFNRFISASEARVFIDWAQDALMTVFPGTRAVCSAVSPYELASVPYLPEGAPDFFYRCVRPGASDIGPAHRDCDLWDALEGTDHLPDMPNWVGSRWKLWMPISGWDASTALTVMPGSHQEQVEIEKTIRAGKSSARIAENYLAENDKRFISPLQSASKHQAIVFHDALVHRAPANTMCETRLSCELTLFSSLNT